MLTSYRLRLHLVSLSSLYGKCSSCFFGSVLGLLLHYVYLRLFTTLHLFCLALTSVLLPSFHIKFNFPYLFLSLCMGFFFHGCFCFVLSLTLHQVKCILQVGVFGSTFLSMNVFESILPSSSLPMLDFVRRTFFLGFVKFFLFVFSCIWQ